MQAARTYLTSLGLIPEQINKVYRMFEFEKSLPIKDNYSTKIIKAVCDYYGITQEELERKRKRPFSEIRFIVFHLLYHNNITSLQNIATLFNMKNHTSVISGLKTNKNLTDTDERYSHDVSKLERIVNEIINQ